MTKTARGFSVHKFKDADGESCSLQISSVDNNIWLGYSELKINAVYPWVDLNKEKLKLYLKCDEVLGNNRMHLTQKQVKKLLPFLIRYAETGEI